MKCVTCSMPKLPGYPATSGCISQRASQHAFLTHGLQPSGRYVTYITLCHANTHTVKREKNICQLRVCLSCMHVAIKSMYFVWAAAVPTKSK